MIYEDFTLFSYLVIKLHILFRYCKYGQLRNFKDFIIAKFLIFKIFDFQDFFLGVPFWNKYLDRLLKWCFYVWNKAQKSIFDGHF